MLLGMQEIIWHGLGGQGAVIASSILGTALSIYEGKYAMSIPSFGAERRGAPVTALTRTSESPIRRRQRLSDPDFIVILDDSLVSTALASLEHEKPRCIIVNSKKSAVDLGLANWQHLTIVDATTIASDVLGRPIPNTVIAGVLAAVTNLVRINSVKKAIADVFVPELVERNITAAEAGFKAWNR